MNDIIVVLDFDSEKFIKLRIIIKQIPSNEFDVSLIQLFRIYKIKYSGSWDS